MSDRIEFHLDENVSNAVANGLRLRGIGVTTTPEVGLISASDEEQVAFAVTEQRVIFTQDDDFLKLHQAGISHHGITYFFSSCIICIMRSPVLKKYRKAIAITPTLFDLCGFICASFQFAHFLTTPD